jgi:hypothetical protein
LRSAPVGYVDTRSALAAAARNGSSPASNNLPRDESPTDEANKQSPRMQPHALRVGPLPKPPAARPSSATTAATGRVLLPPRPPTLHDSPRGVATARGQVKCDWAQQCISVTCAADDQAGSDAGSAPRGEASSKDPPEATSNAGASRVVTAPPPSSRPGSSSTWPPRRPGSGKALPLESPLRVAPAGDSTLSNPQAKHLVHPAEERARREARCRKELGQRDARVRYVAPPAAQSSAIPSSSTAGRPASAPHPAAASPTSTTPRAYSNTRSSQSLAVIGPSADYVTVGVAPAQSSARTVDRTQRAPRPATASTAATPRTFYRTDFLSAWAQQHERTSR